MTRGIPTEGRSASGLGDVDFSNGLRSPNESLSSAQIAVYRVGGAIDSNNYNALDEMASVTGGRKYAFGAVGEALRQAAADSSANYQIAFYSEGEASDGEHHKLRITSTRKDVRLQALPGSYSVLPAEQPLDVERRELAIALHSPYDAADIGLHVSASRDPGASRNTLLDIRIDPADILIGPAQKNRSARVLLLLAAYGASASDQRGAPMSVELNILPEQYSKKGTVRLEEPGHPVSLELNLTPEQYAAAASSGIVLHGSAALGANVQSVRVILIDGELGAAGAVTIPVHH